MNTDGLKALWHLGPGWLIAGAVVLLLVYEGGKKWLPLLLEWVVKRLAAVLAGTRIMRAHALRAYREQVVASSSRLPVMFADDVDIDVSTIYVPLQTAGSDDAYGQVRSTSHAVVLGPPGAGKSMLLRHSMLTWALGDDRGRVPVLLELHRCNGNTSTLAQLLVEQFDRDGFPKADRFVERALRVGGLSLLFDGLDEVNGAERERVAQALRDFVQRYQGCQVLVTCRTAIYHRQLAPEITTTFEVAEFDERLIRRFLRQWPGFGDGIAVDRLLTALRDHPRIMQLAGNPLLLTMIAYLYSNGQTLPHSRAEFYQEATQELLSKLKHVSNQFPGPAKKAVLKRLALVAQDVPKAKSDRRTLGYEQVLSEIAEMLPRLNRTAVEADAMLREIVDRSGLLLAIDGGERYQFAHLSLQEFLAAEALKDDAGGLIGRFRNAPEDWRETVKLWCGTVSTDSAPVIEAVFALDPALAFECLADAQLVDEVVANRITEYFKDRLVGAEPSVITAFGAVAADPRVRGRRTYEFLVRAIESRRQAALAALAATKLPEAAVVLFDAIHGVAELKPLVSMGDIAVPALSTRVHRDWLAVIGLKRIGTPAAAQALAGVVWADDRQAGLAAWCLAELIVDPEIEAALDEVDAPVDVVGLAWVWAPFSDPDKPNLEKVVARIAHLIVNSVEPFPDAKVDPRLSIPLSVFGIVLKRGVSAALGTMNGKIRPDGIECLAAERVEELDKEFARWCVSISTPAVYTYLFDGLSSRVRVAIVDRMFTNDFQLRQRDWAEVFREDGPTGSRVGASVRRVATGIFKFVSLCLFFSVFYSVVTSASYLVFRGWGFGPEWMGWVWILCVLVIFISGFKLDKPLFAGSFVPSRDRGARIMQIVSGQFSHRWMSVLFDVVLLGWILLTIWLGWAVRAFFVDFLLPFGVVLGFAHAVVRVVARGIRREQAASNTLRGLLELDDAAARNRTSVIAG